MFYLFLTASGRSLVIFIIVFSCRGGIRRNEMKGERRKAEGRQAGRQARGRGWRKCQRRCARKWEKQIKGMERIRVGVVFTPEPFQSFLPCPPAREREMLSLKILLTRPFFSLPKCSGGAALGVWLIRFLGIICDFVRQVVTGER